MTFYVVHFKFLKGIIMIWESDGDDGYAYCEHCGKRYSIEIGPPGHICVESMKAHKDELEKWNINFEGTGRVKGRIIIDYECFNSEAAFNSLFDLINLNGGFDKGKHIGSDKVMDCEWKTDHKRENI